MWLIFIFIAASAWAQQTVPPPKPAPSGPPLEVTMKFIQEKVAEVGKLTYAAHYHDSATGKDWVNQWTDEATNVVASPALCKVSYHRLSTRGGQVIENNDQWFYLQAVQDIVVEPEEQELKKGDSAAGHPTWDSRVEPRIWAVWVQRPKGIENYLYFREEAMANRVAKALVHAMELCGGGKKAEPF
jgi:hypothetical protein